MYQDTGATAEHLLMENSRATKFFLDRDARVVLILTSTIYCVSLLVQGELEIPCRVERYMSPTVKNKKLVNITETMLTYFITSEKFLGNVWYIVHRNIIRYTPLGIKSI